MFVNLRPATLVKKASNGNYMRPIAASVRLLLYGFYGYKNYRLSLRNYITETYDAF